MGAPDTRTAADYITEAIDQLDTAVAEAQRMRDHLLSARRAKGDDQRGVLRSAARSGSIAAAAVDQARELAKRAQHAGDSGFGVTGAEASAGGAAGVEELKKYGQDAPRG
jgi:hypothetical protein